MRMIKKKQDMNNVQKKQHYSSAIRPFLFTLEPLGPFLASLYFMDILSTKDTYRLTLKDTYNEPIPSEWL